MIIIVPKFWRGGGGAGLASNLWTLHMCLDEFSLRESPFEGPCDSELQGQTDNVTAGSWCQPSLPNPPPPHDYDPDHHWLFCVHTPCSAKSRFVWFWDWSTRLHAKAEGRGKGHVEGSRKGPQKGSMSPKSVNWHMDNIKRSSVSNSMKKLWAASRLKIRPCVCCCQGSGRTRLEVRWFLIKEASASGHFNRPWTSFHKEVNEHVVQGQERISPPSSPQS